MAYSISYWYDKIITEKNNQAVIKDAFAPNSSTADNLALLLSELSSGSKVSIWRLVAFIVASVNWIQGVYWDLFQAKVQAIADTAQYGNDAWWYAKALAFQLGDAVQVLTDSSGKKYTGYGTIDSTKCIIKIAALTNEGAGAASLKVAKLVSGEYVKLSDEELGHFNDYVQEVQPVGVNINPISRDADLIKYDIWIGFNGLFIEDSVKAAVETAINNYHRSLVFTGRLYLSALGDAIQNAVINTGTETLPVWQKCVVDFQINSAFGKAAAGVSYDAITRSYLTAAGYCKVDPAFPLSTNITYDPA